MGSSTPGRSAARHDGVVELWIAGAGGVGREALDTAIASGVVVAGFLDDRRIDKPTRGLAVLPVEQLPRGDRYIVAIGDPGARLGLATRLDDAGGIATTLVHPRAVVGPETTLEDGCLVMGLAHISSSVRLAAHAQVHYGATLGHDTVLGEGAIVLPGANVAGNVHLGREVMVGSGAIVLQGRTVGDGAVVGAGAVVTRDVPEGVVVVGSPARPLRR